jgi:predicted Ser/Thr protein kinase
MTMTDTAADSKCPRCGAVLDAAVANGICPACLLKQVALGTGADSFPTMPWTPPSVDELSSAFPQLEVLELIGHGGMGAVYKARQKSLGRLVALKILAPQHAANPDFAERFAREAKVLAEVSHPNIVTVHDFGRAGEFFFLTMEFVDGVNLRQAMRAGRLTPQQALAIVPPICEALQFAHDRGIVHRDIKPENLLLDKEGRVKIADFGIARMLRVGARLDVGDGTDGTNRTDKTNTSHLSYPSHEIGLTQESVIGTPSYMAPEQREHPASVDHRADIFSLGVVLYEMLTGELPGAKLQPPSKKVQIDVRLDEIVLRALEQNPELRFQSATELRTRVETTVEYVGNVPHVDRLRPEFSVMEVLGFQTKWGRRCFQLAQLGYLGFLSFLAFVPGFHRALGFSGFFGFFGFFGAAVIIERGHRRRDRVSQDPLANERSQRHKIAIAASVVWLVTGMVLGTVKLKATEVRFRYDFEWLALTLFLLSTAVLLGVAVSKSIKHWCEKRDPHDRTSLFGWLRAVSVLGFAMTLPFVMFTTGLLDGLMSQALIWEGRTFAILLPIGLIGFVALPWASVVLWQARFLLTAASDPQSADIRRQRHRLIVIGTVVAMLIAAWVAISVPARPQPIEVTTRHATVENGQYTFEYSVQNVPGWNVWLTLENAQLINSDSPHLEDRGPIVVSRYQAKLLGNGRVRVPLEYLPATDEGRNKMLASIGPAEEDRAILRPRVQVSRLAFQTESLMRVWAILMMLPEGQTPDSQLIEPTGSPASPRYKTIEPPAQPKLGPFEGTYEQGRIELFALGDHPPNGQPFWKPNGEPLTEAVSELGGLNTAGGKVMKEIVVRVHSATKLAATPVFRFRQNSGFSAMGSSFHRPDAQQPFARFHSAIACPPEARETTIEVGVADGDWHKEIEFPRHDNQARSYLSESGSPNRGTWAGSVRSASIVGDRVPLTFSYSRRDDCETRMTYERDDGMIVPLIGEGSDSNGDMTNALTTLPVAEFQRIKHFRVESRRYQWIEFRNVSLQLGHRTQVGVQNAGLYFPPPVKPIEEASSEKPTDQPATQAPANAAKPSDNETSSSDKIDTTPIIMKLIENEKSVRGFRVKTEAKIRQRVGNNFGLPEIEREIKTSFAIDERGRIRSEQTGGVPGRIGTTDVRQQHEVAVFDGLMLRLLQGNVNEPGNWGYHGRDKYRMPRTVDPRNSLLEHNNQPLREQISGGGYRAVGKETWQGREVVAFESSTTTRESEKTSYRGRLLLDPSLGYAAVSRVSQIRFDDLGPEWHDFARHEVSEYKPSTGGIWVPGRAIYTSLLPSRDVVKSKQTIETAWKHDIRFFDWELNPKFTDDDFKLDFPDGIFVMDETK